MRIGKLTALKVSRATSRGYLNDGGGLYLQISATGGKSWVFRYTADGRLREHGLGSAHVVSLAEAREAAAHCRKQRHQGIDPIEARKATRAATRLEAAKTMTFKESAEAYIESHRAGWSNDKHAAQWTATLTTYAYPAFGELPVAAIDVGLVLKAIEPIWAKKPETATRLRGRIESVLDWARVRGYRVGENPARWKGNIDHLLPARAKVAKVTHHAALPYAEIGSFIAKLKEQEGAGALALRLAILTAARTGEVLGATWDEVDLDAKVWTVPAERMKSGREHRVPLSDEALAILKAAAKIRTGDHVFPGAKSAKPLSNMALLMTLRRMGRDDLTAHGFRSTFRDWAAERTSYPREVAEAALAHVLADKVEAAYRRSDLFDKRRALMVAWGRYCGTATAGGKIVPINAG